MTHLLRRTTSTTCLTALLVAATAVGVSAVAHAADAPVPVEVAMTGPATGDAGGTGDFTVVVRNTSTALAGALQLRPELPEGITVLAVGATDAWACVLGPLRCTLPAGLEPGATSEALPVELHYDGLVEGRQVVGVLVGQGDGPERVDAGRTTVDVTGAPDWVLPEEEPAPAPAAPAPAAPAPAAPATATPVAAPAAPAPAAPVAAPAPAAAAPAPAAAAPAAPAPAPAAPAPVVDEPADAPVELAPAPSDAAPAPALDPEAPAALPFAVEEEPADEAGTDGDTDVTATVPVASASDGAQGIYTALLALVFGTVLVAFVYLVSRVIAQQRTA